MSTPRYAARTDVTSDRTVAEIQRVLIRYGATAFSFGWESVAAYVAFEIANRRILFRLPLPDRNDLEFTHTPGRRVPRDADSASREYDRAVRAKWRALLLIIKAKLEAVTAGVTTIEQEFLAHILVPGTAGTTAGDLALPVIAKAYATGELPAILPGAAGSDGSR